MINKINSTTPHAKPNFGMALEVKPGKVLNSLKIEEKGSLALATIENEFNEHFNVVIGDTIQLVNNKSKKIVASYDPFKKESWLSKIFHSKPSTAWVIEDYTKNANKLRSEAISNEFTKKEEEITGKALLELYEQCGVPK